MTDRLLQFDLSADDQALFLAELDELLQRVEESLVDLERAPDEQGLLNEIFRAAHTIKGSSATVGHARMAALTHAMETRLDGVRKRVAAVTPQLIEALLKALDVLKLLRDEVQTRIAANVDVDAVAGAVERRASPRAPVMKSSSARRSRKLEHADATHRFHVVLVDGARAAVRATGAPGTERAWQSPGQPAYTGGDRDRGQQDPLAPDGAGSVGQTRAGTAGLAEQRA